MELVYHESFQNALDAVAMERRLKGWSRAKKEALIKGYSDALKRLAKPGPKCTKTSFDSRASLVARDEGN